MAQTLPTHQVDHEYYQCDCCLHAAKIFFKCPICRTCYCSEECRIEDEKEHGDICGQMVDEQKNTLELRHMISTVFRTLGVEESNHFFVKDSIGRKYMPFPGKLPRTPPRCMITVKEPDGFGRFIWESMSVMIGTLDLWYYLVKLEDLPKCFARMKPEMVEALMILLKMHTSKIERIMGDPSEKK